MKRWLVGGVVLVGMASAAGADEGLPGATAAPAQGGAVAVKAVPVEVPAALTEYLELSGAKRGLEGLPSSLAKLILKAEKVNDAMAAALADALTPGPFYRRVVGVLAQGYDEARFASLLAWARSPLGKRISALGEAADRDPKALQARIEAQKQTPPSAERLELVRRLVTADDVIGTVNGAARALFGGLAAFVQRVLPQGSASPPGLIASMPAQTKNGAEPFVPHYLGTYAALSDAELQQYLDHTVAADSRWYDALERKAVNEAMQDAGARMGAAMLRFAMRVKGSL